jgi:hypothetical protein
MVREHRAELQEIFDLIDSMPMRQREMREKGKTPRSFIAFTAPRPYPFL